MDKIPFEDGTLVTAGYVEIDGIKHEIVQPEYTGNTPLSAYNLNNMQDNIEIATKITRLSIEGNSIQKTTSIENGDEYNSPSIDYPSPIKSVGDNINVFDIETFAENNSAYYTLTNGILTNIQTDSRSSGFDYILYKAGTYTIRTQNVCRMRVFEEGNTTAIAQVNDDKTLTFTIEGDTNLHFKFFNTAVPSEIGTVKIVEGASTGAYSPYGQGCIEIKAEDGTISETKALSTQKPFRTLGNVKDRFVKIEGEWYEKHYIKRKMFTGDEDFGINAEWNSSAPDLIHAYTNISDWKIAQVNAILNQFNFVNRDNRDFAMEQAYCSEANTALYLFVKTERINGINTTIDNFKEWLAELYTSGNAIYIDYELATPELIACTVEQVEVLNDIYSAYGDGLNDIICTDEIPAIIEITKESKETVQSENDKAISALLERVTLLEETIASMQTVEEEGV